MHVLLMTLGSHGDVHPFIGLGLALRERGHSLTFATNAYFQPLVERAGFTEFIPLGSADDYRAIAVSSDLWHPRRGFQAVIGMVTRSLPEVYDAAAAYHASHTDSVVVASTLCLGARIAQDKLAFPMASVHLAPSIFRSVHHSPKLPGLFMPPWFPIWLKKKIWEGGDRFILDPIVAPAINELRAEKGLPPVKRLLDQWWHSPDRVIGLWPDWYAPPQPDWPKQTVLAGFPLYDERGLEPLPPDLQEFLAAGEAPVAFTPGSAMWSGQDFFRASIDACQRLNRRGLLLTRHADQIPTPLPPTVRHVAYAPFSELLPRVAAIVHHGGIGTTSQSLAAGIPQLIMAMSHDQPDNADRVKRLGVGLQISRSAYKGPRIARLLDRLLRDPATASACRSIAARFEHHRPFQIAVEAIEQLTPTFSPASSHAGPRAGHHPPPTRSPS